MIKLNDNNIIVGEIKQILHTFNLPRCAVGFENKKLNSHYIDKNNIYKCEEKDGKIISTFVTPYIYGKKYLNLTTNLKLENNLYDRYTHRYLGEYLRFLRDYKNIDLMSMYNCFDGEVNEDQVNLSLDSSSSDRKFGGVDGAFITYSVPVKKGQSYTLGIQSPSLPIEVCVVIHNSLASFRNHNNEIVSKYSNLILAQNTYTKVTTFNRAYLDKLWDKIEANKGLNEFVDFYKDELRLLIKVPQALSRSTIVLLEGDYRYIYHKHNFLKPVKLDNTSSGGYNYNEKPDFKFYTNPQLFSYLNQNDNNLLGDRLIEYLTGNAISSLSEDYDIIKLQKALQSFAPQKNYVDPDDPYYYGTWNKADRIKIINDLIFGKSIAADKNIYDMIGYCDKDIEQADKFLLEDDSGLHLSD